jgi:hypothetical protein
LHVGSSVAEVVTMDLGTSAIGYNNGGILNFLGGGGGDVAGIKGTFVTDDVGLLEFQTYVGSAGTRMAIKGSNVGIGTTAPAEKLEVKGGNISIRNSIVAGSTPSSNGILKFYGDNTTTAFYAGIESYRGNYSDDNDLRFFTQYAGAGPSERMRITNTGNVGIGTPNPTAKLDVNGSASFNGNITANNICYSNGTGCSSTGTYNATYDATSADVTANRSNWFSTYNATYDAKVSANLSFNQTLTDSLYLGKTDQRYNITNTNITVQNILPQTDSSYSLGSSILRWLKGWFVDLDVSNNLVVGKNITTDKLFTNATSMTYIWAKRNTTTNTNLTASVTNFINFTTEYSDTLNELDASGRFTAKEAGIYEYTFSGTWLVAVNSKDYISLTELNKSNVLSYPSGYRFQSTVIGVSVNMIHDYLPWRESGIVSLNAGDNLRFGLYHGNSIVQQIYTAGGSNDLYMPTIQITRIR